MEAHGLFPKSWASSCEDACAKTALLTESTSFSEFSNGKAEKEKAKLNGGEETSSERSGMVSTWKSSSSPEFSDVDSLEASEETSLLDKDINDDERLSRKVSETALQEDVIICTRASGNVCKVGVSDLIPASPFVLDESSNINLNLIHQCLWVKDSTSREACVLPETERLGKATQMPRLKLNSAVYPTMDPERRSGNHVSLKHLIIEANAILNDNKWRKQERLLQILEGMLLVCDDMIIEAKAVFDEIWLLAETDQISLPTKSLAGLLTGSIGTCLRAVSKYVKGKEPPRSPFIQVCAENAKAFQMAALFSYRILVHHQYDDDMAKNIADYPRKVMALTTPKHLVDLYPRDCRKIVTDLIVEEYNIPHEDLEKRFGIAATDMDIVNSEWQQILLRHYPCSYRCLTVNELEEGPPGPFCAPEFPNIHHIYESSKLMEDSILMVAPTDYSLQSDSMLQASKCEQQPSSSDDSYHWPDKELESSNKAFHVNEAGEQLQELCHPQSNSVTPDSKTTSKMLKSDAILSNLLTEARALLSGATDSKQKGMKLSSVLHEILTFCNRKEDDNLELKEVLNEIWLLAERGQVYLPSKHLNDLLTASIDTCHKAVMTYLKGEDPPGSPLVQVCAKHPEAFQVATTLMHQTYVHYDYNTTIGKKVMIFPRKILATSTSLGTFIELYPSDCQEVVLLMNADDAFVSKEEQKEFSSFLLTAMDKVNLEWQQVLMVQFPCWYKHMVTQVLNGEIPGPFARQLHDNALQSCGDKETALAKVSQLGVRRRLNF